MISIIICARKSDIAETLRQNIESTIGLVHEIIVINNSENKYNIFSAYNEGVRLSKFPFLLFMHDDVLMHTDHWGDKLLQHFNDEKVGAVGIAGTPYLSYAPGGWWSNGMGHLYLLQSNKPGQAPEFQNIFPKNSSEENVVVLDGVWFCIRKSLFDVIRFDDKTFNGFHFYDADISVQISRAGYRLLCINDILLHHLSMGVLDKKWVDNAYIFHKKWKSQLPLATVDYGLAWQCKIEQRSVKEFIDTQLQNVPELTKSSVYSSALKHLLSFKKGFHYYKTPVWILRLLYKYLTSRVAGK